MTVNLAYGAFDLGMEDPTPSEDLTGYEGQGVYWNGTAWAPASLTSQVVTLGLGFNERFGVVVEGGETTEALTTAYCEGGGLVEATAGTGGVTVGDYVVPEYAASGTDRGRFIDNTNGWHAGEVAWGRAMNTAAEDGMFMLDMGARFVAADQIPYRPGTALATVGAGTYTAAMLLTGRILRDCAGGARTDSLTTAALLITAMANRGMSTIGDSFSCVIVNTSDAAETITIQEDGAADADMLLVTSGADLDVDQTEEATIVFTLAEADKLTAFLAKA